MEVKKPKGRKRNKRRRCRLDEAPGWKPGDESLGVRVPPPPHQGHDGWKLHPDKVVGRNALAGVVLPALVEEINLRLGPRRHYTLSYHCDMTRRIVNSGGMPPPSDYHVCRNIAVHGLFASLIVVGNEQYMDVVVDGRSVLGDNANCIEGSGRKDLRVDDPDLPDKVIALLDKLYAQQAEERRGAW